MLVPRGVGAEYTVSKIVYFSPRFAGFDFGASFAPNNGANNAVAIDHGGPLLVAHASVFRCALANHGLHDAAQTTGVGQCRTVWFFLRRAGENCCGEER